jgi:NAD(P)-dependent dehydrogenase (short-subunit alcohol dehydrogenase family)
VRFRRGAGRGASGRAGIRDLRGAVVVITGASSGIGRAAARSFADQGARIVLAARGPGDLEDAAAECRAAGGEALVHVTDVTEEEAVQRLASAAIERFGHIDVWINNAGVIAYAPFEELPAEAFRRVIETNLFGQVHGARAALAHFRRQGHGILINTCSVWGRVTSPYVSAYVASKFAIRALGECLHQELADEPGIDVVTLLPGSVDTPIFHHAGNWTGRAIRPIPPVAAPDEVAEAMLRCARDPRREVTLGRAGHLLEAMHMSMPGVFASLVPQVFRASALGGPVAPSDGNLFEPAPNRVRGGWRHGWPRGAKALMGTAAGAVAWAATRRAAN